MSSSLSAQLAQVAAKSSNPLDLKAQKNVHSQSLIFDSKVAANQGFENIYQLCLEGFQELCRLDKRFTVFTRSIFSQQSQTQDRNQMTKSENDKLNGTIDSFLCLISARLILKPALNAVEWLVRRFRSHEHNTVNLVLAFLPYHSLPIFLPLLSILPRNQSPALKWLHPYVASLASPPKTAIVHAAVHNPSFFSAYNAFMLQSCHESHHDRAFVSCWAVVATEAVAGMIDRAKSGRREIQEQNEHDVLTRILPLLNEGLAMRDVGEMRIACYMIITVVASKSQLGPEFLDALMDAIVASWTPDTTHAGLICLAVLSQNRKEIGFDQKVFDAIMSIKTLNDDLVMLKQRYWIDRLVLGLFQGVLGLPKDSQSSSDVKFIKSVFENSLLDAKYSKMAIKILLSTADKTDFTAPGSSKLLGHLADLIQGLSNDEVYRPAVLSAIQDDGIDLEHLQAKLQTNLQLEDISDPDVEMTEVEETAPDQHLQKALQHIPSRTTQEVSFLAQLDSYLFTSLTRAFLLCLETSQDLSQLYNLPVLGRASAMEEPLFFSFFFRVSSSILPIGARVAALQCLHERLEIAEPIPDLQMFFPYLLYNLADPVLKVRTAAVDLASVILTKYRSLSQKRKDKEVLILGKNSLYDTEEAEFESVLSFGNSLSFVENIFGPILDECRLDAEHAPRRISGFLEDTMQAKHVASDAKAFKKSSRMLLLHNLASHIIATPIYQVKLRSLSILDGVGKVGNTSRTRCLLPLIDAYLNQTEQQFREPLVHAQINEKEYTKALVGILMPSDSEGLKMLHRLVDPEQGSFPPQLLLQAHQHIRSCWSEFKAIAKDTMVVHLLDLATKDSGKHNNIAGGQALETLQDVSVPTTAFILILESRSRLSETTKSSSSPKRRRTSHGPVSAKEATSDGTLEAKLRALTITLELVENSKEAKDERLLPGLFQILEDILHSKGALGAGLGYVLSTVLGCIRYVMEMIKDFQPSFDRSKIRPDLVVDGLRASTTPQSQNTALLLLAKLATVAPDLVFHTVMPIFTFMGSSVMNQTDEYSVHVIDKTIDSVVPPLLNSLRKKNADVLAGTSELLLSFVAAYEHMPPQRRLHLFELLINKLGPTDFLHAILALLIDKYRDDKDVRSFAGNLASRYEPIARLTAMQKYVELTMDCLSLRCTISKTLSLGEDSTPQASAARFLEFARQVLGDSRLKSRISRSFSKGPPDSKELETARSCFSMMLENLLQMIVNTKADKNLSTAIDGAIRALLDLFPIREYALSLQKLLENGDPQIQHQALSSLEVRIDSSEKGSSITSTAIIGILPTLTSLFQTTEVSLTKITSLACIDRIFAQFGKTNNDVTLGTAQALIGNSGLGSTDSTIVTGAFDCLSTATLVLGEAAVPIVPDITRKAIGQLKKIIDEELEEERLHNAAYSFFGSILKRLPWILSGKTLEDFLKVSHGSANAELSLACNQTRQTVLDLMAKQVDPKECFVALKKTCQSAVTEGPKAIKEHFDIFEIATRVCPKSTLKKHVQVLCDTILYAFDLRRSQLCPRTDDSYEDEEIDEVETEVNQVAVNMIHKLSDESFRPVFAKMQEWSTTLPASKKQDGRLYRQTTWFKFLHTFFETIKSLGTHYASFIVEQSNALLKSSMIKKPDSLLLLNTVILALGSCFKYDKDEFFQSHSSYIPVLGMSLIALIPHSTSLPPLLPALVSLAACISAPDQRKMLNTAILRHFRSDDAGTRLAAVKVQRGITEKCGEDWVMEQMAETSAAIVELREDDSEEVERELARWEKELEPILGEEYAEMLG